ncbi:MAG: RNA polymerase sigma factor [Actinomycetota bacterium]
MDDATLVHRAAAGDRAAWAGIYDRYADRLHDYCCSILRDRHEAEDALHDAFVVAAGRIHQLRDPSRLRPWLYAICRTSALARARRRARAVPTEGAADMSPAAVDEPGAERAELARLVQDAAGGLAARDRAVLDLHLRHGLEGAELGEALGVDAHHAAVLLSRVRDLVERSLGALLVARTGRRECPELDRLLAGWDGGLSPLLRKRVARHLDRCEVCGERRRRMVSPLALLAAAPPVLAPSTLRERVLGDVVRVSSAGPGGGGGGTAGGRRRPGPVAGAGAPRRGRALAAAAAAAVLVGLGVAALTAGCGYGSPVPTVAASAGRPAGSAASSSSSTAGGPAPSTTADPAVPGTGPAPAATVPPATTAPATTAPPVTTTAPAPAPVLVVATPALDLGTAATSAPLRFANGGGQALAWTVTSPAPALTAAPASGVLAPGAEATVTVTLDRAGVAEGEVRVELLVGGRGAADGAAVAPAAVPVTAVQERPPVVSGLATERPRLVFASSTCATTRATADVSDESTLTVVLTWRQATGPATEVAMGVVGPGRYGATIGPVPTPGGGDVSWFVTATDARGNRTRSPDRVLPVATAC